MPGRNADSGNAIANMGEATVTTPNERELVITRSFNAPRAVVFEAWTRPEHVTRWWDPSGTPLASCEIDLRVGGEFRFVNAGSGHAFAGVYREIVPPERLVFTSKAGAAAAEVTGRLSFGEQQGRTTLVLTMACASRADRDALLAMKIDAGTIRSLQNLAAYVEA
jgi:uncharacterized protein YndB with AHSA1/START domain